MPADRTGDEVEPGAMRPAHHDRKVLLEAVTGAEGVLDRPSPEVWVEEFADSGVGVAVRFWHAPDIATLWRVRSEVAVATRRALERDGIEIPFPQRVVRFADGAFAHGTGDDAKRRSTTGSPGPDGPLPVDG